VLTVLVIGNGQEDRVPLRDALLPAGFRVKEAASGPAALDTIRKEAVDIVLLELNESAPDAMESCRFLQGNRDEMMGIPVLAVTGLHEKAVLAALRAGADDFFEGPLEGKLLGEKVMAHVRLRKEYERRLDKGMALGFRDSPAASAIPAYFRMRLKEEFERSQRYKKQLTLALMAIIDGETGTNSRGAQLEEPLPPDPARAIRVAFRRTDIFAQCGENEFSVLMPETRSDQVFTRISDLKEKIRKDLSRGGGEKPGVDVRIGMASLPIRSSENSTIRMIRSPEEFFRMARLALFHARLNENRPVALFDG
jgi:PleD family two-component response regulator